MPMKDFRGAAGSTSSSDPRQKPTEGSARAGSVKWQGAYDSTVPSNPNEKPPGSAKIPGGGK